MQLNPILGETFQASAEDGTACYLEQTCHHPPVTTYQFDGPDGLYSLTGWSSFSVKAWFNSATLTADGYKRVTFPDGMTIQWNNQGDQFNNIFMGTIGHQVTGKIYFKDNIHGITGMINMGQVSRR
jgi:hypothetical protein